jgi:hypothetical protein
VRWQTSLLWHWHHNAGPRGSSLRFNSLTVLVNAHLVGTEVLVLPCWYPIRSGVTINGMRTIADRNGSAIAKLKPSDVVYLAVIRSVCACEQSLCLAYFEGEKAAPAHRVRRFWRCWVQERNRKTESTDRSLLEDPLSAPL